MNLRQLFPRIKKDLLIPPVHRDQTSKVPLLVFGGVLLLIVLFVVLLSTPRAFPVETRIEIEEGSSVRAITTMLDETDVVRSRLMLQMVLALRHPFDSIKAGVYTFDQRKSVFEIAEIITEGTDGTPLVRVTVPEGLRGRDLIEIFTEAGLTNEMSLSVEDIDMYIGYLYPDTYLVPETYTFSEMVALMQETYEEKVAPLRDAFKTLSESEVITLASIVEREAKDEASKRIVAGILLSRLEIGMALQVDASFSYLLDKESAELTLEDLKIDSPYNTYLYPGLPPTPIANPGLESIKAVLDPEITEYVYYLTAPDGTFYYAETFEEHKQNKERYLR
ncbi:endolytic transglycosylase MltG [Candidatus Kaiserbacteria bacterium]|nr:endolytic transglycosylase MltG [Candidatus Kaiserbacteria bacterium]